MDSESSACIGGCNCTDDSTVLGVDASHIYLLERATSLLQSVDVADLLAAHKCNNGRLMVTSDYCRAAELEKCLSEEESGTHFSSYSDDGWDGIPTQTAATSGRRFDEGDRRLSIATDTAGAAEDCDPWLVSDDEDFLLNLRESAIMMLVGVVPIHSCRLLLRMHSCGTVGVRVLQAVLQAEQLRLDNDQRMQERKRDAKQESLDRMANVLGLEVSL